MFYMLTHGDFLNLFTVAIAFNLAYVVRGNRIPGFMEFLDIFHQSQMNFFVTSSGKKMEDITRTIHCLEYFGNTQMNVFKKEIDDIKLAGRKIDTIFNRAIEKHKYIINMDHLSSICLLLGLYGIVVLFVTPFEKDVSMNLYLFNMNCLCMCVLLRCLLWDYACNCKGESVFSVICKLLSKKIIEPKRRYILLVFIFMLVVCWGYFYLNFSSYGFVNIDKWFLDRTYGFTIFVCYSSFLIYGLYFFVNSLCIKFACRLKVYWILYDSGFLKHWKKINSQMFMWEKDVREGKFIDKTAFND